MDILLLIHFDMCDHLLCVTSFTYHVGKNNIALLFPEAMFLCSSANEEHTEGDIMEMGVRLAQEVNNYIA